MKYLKISTKIIFGMFLIMQGLLNIEYSLPDITVSLAALWLGGKEIFHGVIDLSIS